MVKPTGTQQSHRRTSGLSGAGRALALLACAAYLALGPCPHVASGDDGSSAPAEPGQSYPTYEVKLVPDGDAFVSSARPEQNFGGDSRLFVGEHDPYGATRTLVSFDLDALDRREVVLEGELRMYVRDAGPPGDSTRDVVVRRVRSDWREGEVTWNRFPGSDDDRLASTGIGTGGGWYSWGVDRTVRKWYYEDWDNEGLYIQGYEAGGSHRAFDSSEGANEPELMLTVAIDDKPPYAALNPLPPFVNRRDILLTWEEGEDPDPASGIDFYEVWYREDEGSWHRIAEEVEEEEYLFRETRNGRRYRFKLIAVDRAGNRQPDGPAQAQTVVDLDPPLAQLEELPQWVNGPFSLVWQGEDLPRAPLRNSGIQHFDLQYSINSGAWGTLVLGTTDRTMVFEPRNGLSYRYRVRAIDRARNIGEFGPRLAQTTADMLAPVVRIDPVSGVDSPEFTVRWAGTDHGGSGVTTYDVQYRVYPGEWQYLVTDTPERHYDFTGDYGYSYAFRARARDLAGNTGDFPEGAPSWRWVHVIEGDSLVSVTFLPIAGQHR